MSGIRIVSTTENGNRAIKRNVEEHGNASLRERLLFRQAFRMEYQEDPAILTITGKHKYLGPNLIEPIAVDMMSENGATPDDYYIEVIEDV